MRSLLILTGSMGAGKSTILAEASDLLAQRNIPHAAIDFDALGLAHLPPESPASGNDSIMNANLRSVCENYSSAGVSRYLLTLALEDSSDLEACKNAISPTETIICRITASVETMQDRIRTRETGILQQQFVDRVAILNATLDAAKLEDFTVANDGRSVIEAALELLRKAHWIAE